MGEHLSINTLYMAPLTSMYTVDYFQVRTSTADEESSKFVWAGQE